MMDHFDLYDSYGHGDNSSKGKENTAPYATGNIAAGHVRQMKPDFNEREIGEIKYKKPSIWSRFRRFLKRLL